MIPLKSKLMIPGTVDLIQRNRLDSLIDDIPHKKLTIISAGPGYGKTAFAASAVHALNKDTVWYSLDAADSDTRVFLTYLLTGIKFFYPRFEYHWGDYGQPQMDIDEITARFLPALESCLKNDLFIVLDGYQNIGKVPEIRFFLQALTEDHFSPFFHLILVSRTTPELKMSRLMAGRQLLMITDRHLALDPDEITTFFHRLFDISLTGQQAQALYHKTGGWVSGLVLFYEALNNPSSLNLDKAIKKLKGTHRHIACYLEENIYQVMSAPLKDFVLKTAGLSQLNVEFCNQLLQTSNARAILSELEDLNFFTSSKDQERESFSYHRLFQDYLKSRQKDKLSEKTIKQLHNDTALLYEKNDNGQEALRHHILAGNIDDAARLLNRLARPIIKQSRPQMLKSLLSSIPQHYMDDEPWFQYLQAGYLGLCNQLQLAVRGYETVLKRFSKSNNEEGECLCRMELAEYYMSTGDHKRSEAEYKKILDINRLDDFLTIIVIGYLIRVLTLLRKPSEADKYAQKAISLLDRLEDESSIKTAQGWIYITQGFRYAFTGMYHHALEKGEKSKRLLKSAEQYRLMFSSYYLISYACFYLGRFSKGMAAANEGFHIDRKKGGFDEYTQFLLLLHARNCLELESVSANRIDKAIEDCNKALRAFQKNAFPGGVAQAFLVLHKAYLKKGEQSIARQCLEKGIASLKDHDMPLIENELKVALSRMLIFTNDVELKKTAMGLLKEAEKKLQYSSWHICWISRIFARYYWEHSHKETCFEYIVYSLKISQEEGYDTWILSEKDWIIPLLVELYAMKSMDSYIKKLVIKMGERSKDCLMKLAGHDRPDIRKAAGQLAEFLPQKPPPSLRASFFGPFRLYVGDREISSSQWKSNKARTLFKFLLFMRPKGFLDKEILMELLWPDEDPKKSVQRFHVALAAVRKVLEPKILKGVKSAYIHRSGPSYKIEIGENGQIDTEIFQACLTRAGQTGNRKEAFRNYLEAVGVYTGEFLEDDPYTDWILEERERLKKTYLNALKHIINHFERQKDWASCIRYANKYLEVDKYSETVIRGLMRYYSSTGDRPMVVRIYETFRETLKKELDCSLSSRTQTLYSQLTAG